MSEFRVFLEAAARRFRTKAEFAKALGITPGRLSRVLRGEHSLDVLNCLTLARLTGESPTRVLRVAGKDEIAASIEALYGPGQSAVSEADRELLDAWSTLPERQRETVKGLIAEFHDIVQQGGTTRRTGARPFHRGDREHRGAAGPAVQSDAPRRAKRRATK